MLQVNFQGRMPGFLMLFSIHCQMHLLPIFPTVSY
jgi:hypothetical protein